MADGKWITDLTADTPLPEAARQVFGVRLKVVGDYLPLAVREAGRDPEFVHQLRVGTRRADAALRIFRPCLPKKVHKKARRRLRKVRRAAGAVRDWDVFLIQLAEFRKKQPAKNQAGIDFLLGYALGQRAAAQRQLEEAGEKHGEDFSGFIAGITDAVRAPDDPDAPSSLLGLARPVLAELLGDLDRAAAGDLTDYSQLHQVRIAGKRLRYAMEVFAPCFSAAFRDTLYPMIEEVQEILGLANDSHVAADRLGDLRDGLRRTHKAVWPRLQPGLAALLRLHQRRLPQERRRFLRWWERWQKSGAEAMLNGLLAGEKALPE